MELRNRRRRRLGFTLVELLVVIGILSILAALLFPVFISVRANSAKVTCLSNLRQTGAAIALYAQDYDDYLPYALDPGTKHLLLIGVPIYGDPIDGERRNLPDIKAILAPYNAADALFRCPWDRRTLETREPFARSTWFEINGTSYQYNEWNALQVTPLGHFQKPASSFLMGDLECFHNRPEEGCGLFNVLHMDFHVKSLTLAQRQDVIDNTERGANAP